MGRRSFSSIIEEMVKSCEEPWNLEPDCMNWKFISTIYQLNDPVQNLYPKLKHKGDFSVILKEKPFLRNSLSHIFIFRIWIILVISLNVTMWKGVNTVLNTSKWSASGIYYHTSPNHIWKLNVVERSQSENPIPVFFSLWQSRLFTKYFRFPVIQAHGSWTLQSPW